MGPWTGGGPLSYEDSIPGVSNQILADHDLDYGSPFGDWIDVRCVIVDESTVAFVDRSRVVMSSYDLDPHLTLIDVLSWMAACGCTGMVDVWVGYGMTADADRVSVDDLDTSIAVIGWVE